MSKVNTDNLTKLYYSIGEVAEMFEVNSSLIRFWEKEFTQLKPKKNKKGNRLFTVKDIDKLNSIYFLVKEKGFTLDGAKSQLKKGIEEFETQSVSSDQKENNHEEVIQKLEALKNKIISMKTSSY